MAYSGGYAGGYADGAVTYPVLGSTSYGETAYAMEAYAGTSSLLSTDTPFVAVEWSLAQPLAEPVWVDVSPHLRSAVSDRGRDRELERFKAGRCTFTFSNADRTFDPNYASSPLSGHLKPMRRVRIRATWEGATFPIFDGYVDSILQEYAPPNESWAVVQATDATKVLTGLELSSSVYTEEVSTDVPVHWWRLHDSKDQLVALDHGSSPVHGLHGNGPGVTDQYPDWGHAGLVTRDPGTSLFMDGSQHINVDAAGSLGPGNTTFSVEAVVRPISEGLPTTSTVRVYDQTGPSLSIQGSSSGGKFGWMGLTSTTSWSVDDGSGGASDPRRIYHLVGTYDNGNVALYVNGVLEATGMSTAPTTSAVQIAGTRPAGAAVEYQEIAVYHSALPASRVAAHADARSTPWDGDTPGARVTRILNASEWHSDLRDIDDGSVTLQSATLGGTAHAHLVKVADSEFGSLFVTADGKVRFEDRANLFSNDVATVTFGDGAGELGYAGYESEYAGDTLRNRVTVSRADGVAQTVQDDTSVDEYLLHTWTRDGLLYDDDDVSLSAANFLLSEYKDPKQRITSLEFTPQGDPANMFPVLLVMELGDRVTVRRRPQGLGAMIEQESAVEGIRWEVRPKLWRCRLRLSPTFTGTFFQLDRTSGDGLGAMRLSF